MRSLILLSCLLFLASEVKSQQLNKVEDFETFLIKFKEDSTFQKSRLISPVTIIYSTDELVEVEDGLYEFAMDTIQVSSEDWKLESLSFRENIENHIISESSEEIHYRIRGVDNGIFIVYTFASKDGKWFLKKYKDEST